MHCVFTKGQTMSKTAREAIGPDAERAGREETGELLETISA
jgi:hypothetical protein